MFPRGVVKSYPLLNMAFQRMQEQPRPHIPFSRVQASMLMALLPLRPHQALKVSEDSMVLVQALLQCWPLL